MGVTERRATVVAAVTLALASLAASGSAGGDETPAPRRAAAKRWAVAYSRDLTPEALRRFDLVVVDPDVARTPGELRPPGGRLLAYLSVGEVNETRTYFDHVRSQRWLIRENAAWRGSFLVDVRAPGWQRLLVDRIARGILDRGFDGFFLDTLDTAEVLQRENADAYLGSIEAMAALVRALRTAYPRAVLLSNNAFEVIDHVAPLLDGVVAESLFTTYDASTRLYHPVSPFRRSEKVAALRELRRRHGTPIFTLDYAGLHDAALRASAYDASRALGFIPYVGAVDLQDVQPSP